MSRKYLFLIPVVFLLMIVTAGWSEPVVKEIYFSKVTTLPVSRYILRFSLWDDEVSGNPLWAEEKMIKLTTADKNTGWDQAGCCGEVWADIHLQFQHDLGAIMLADRRFGVSDRTSVCREQSVLAIELCGTNYPTVKKKNLYL